LFYVHGCCLDAIAWFTGLRPNKAPVPGELTLIEPNPELATGGATFIPVPAEAEGRTFVRTWFAVFFKAEVTP
jgi:hypothetical protein